MFTIEAGCDLYKTSHNCLETTAVCQIFTEQNEHCDWLILGHVLMIKFKCIPTGIQ